jgi:hypothetical protein
VKRAILEIRTSSMTPENGLPLTLYGREPITKGSGLADTYLLAAPWNFPLTYSAGTSHLERQDGFVDAAQRFSCKNAPLPMTLKTLLAVLLSALPAPEDDPAVTHLANVARIEIPEDVSAKFIWEDTIVASSVIGCEPS